MQAIIERAQLIARVLEIAAPKEASAEEWTQWVAWWEPSYNAAREMADEEKAYLKSGGWWPPLSAAQIGIALSL